MYTGRYTPEEAKQQRSEQKVYCQYVLWLVVAPQQGVEWQRLTRALGFRIDDHPGKHAIMERALQQLWAMDVTVVVAAGNDGQFVTLDEISPQNQGTDTNELITVGGVDRQGVLYTDTIFPDGDKGGALNLYAGAVNVIAAVHDGAFDATGPFTGTSVAAPAVVSSPFSPCYLKYCRNKTRLIQTLCARLGSRRTSSHFLP